jgi:hypothetical protein
LAPCLILLEQEANQLAPHRSKLSDGSIGDVSHQARTSDHNIDGGYVHALDLTHDPAGGFDAHLHARDVANRRDSRIKYIISQRRIWYPVGGWKPYNGVNAHDKHAHFSVLHTDVARKNMGWWLTPTPGPIPPTPTPTPPSPVTTAPPGADMYIAAIGTGFFWQCGNVTGPMDVDLGSFAKLLESSDNVPVLTIPQAQVQDWFKKAVNQTLVATGQPPLPA